MEQNPPEEDGTLSADQENASPIEPEVSLSHLKPSAS